MRTRLASTTVALVVAALCAPASALAAADLSVTVTADTTSIPLSGAETVGVTVGVSNTGLDPAENVSTGVTIGAPQLRFTGFAGISQGVAIFGASSDPPIMASFGRIASGATATVRFVIDDAQSGTGVVQARARTDTPDGDTANDVSSANVDVTALVPSVNPLLFGIQAPGATSTQTLVLTNRAAVPVSVGGIQFEGGDFAKSTDGCSGTRLAVDASCQLAVQFTSAAPGERSGRAVVPSSTDKVAPLSISLFGTIVEPPDIDDPLFQLARVPRLLSERRFRKGFPVRVTPNEPVALEVDLQGTPRRGALASAFELGLFQRSLPLAGGTRSLRVKPRGKLVGPIRRRFKVRLKVVATDASGNRSLLVRTIGVKPRGRRR